MQYLYHYLHRTVRYNLSYQKYLDNLQAGAIFTFNWKYFFFPFIYSINHKMVIASILFFNNYVFGVLLATLLTQGRGLDEQTQNNMFLFGFFAAHIFNCFIFNYFYYLRINNLIAKFGHDHQTFQMKIRPIGFHALKNFEVQCGLNTIIIFSVNAVFLIGVSIAYSYLLDFFT